MFPIKHPRETARDMHTGRRIGAVVTTLALGAGFTLAGAGAVQAAPSVASVPKPVSFAQGQFLSGSLLGIDLDSIAAVQAATAVNYGSGATMTSKDPLAVTALDTVTVGSGSSVQADLGDVVQLGAVGQYAQATAGGVSDAAAGAIGPDGAVGLGEDKAVPGGNATVDLSALLGDDFASNLVDLDLAVKAVAAQAHAEGENASGGYTLADATLELSSPAISRLTEKVNAALDSVTNRLAVLDGSDGALAVDVNNILTKLAPSLSLLGAGSNVTATINTGDLKALVSDLLTAQYGDSGVTFNLETGVVSLDLAALAGVDINNLAPGTELLSDAVVGEALDNITEKVANIADQVVTRVTGALRNATVEIRANVDLDVAQAPLVKQVCNTVQKVIEVPTQVLQRTTILVPTLNGVVGSVVNGVPQINGIPVVNGLLSSSGLIGGLLGGVGQKVTWITQNVDTYVTQLVSKTVDQVVCNNVSTALPSLKTSLDLDLVGTVDQFVAGTGVSAAAKVKVLGVVNTSLNLDLLTDQIGDSLLNGLLDSDGAVRDLVDALNTGLVDPAVKGLLDGDNAVGGITDLLSVTANNQEISDGTFSVTALRVSVLGGDGAEINLARATVGPNVTTVVTCQVDCGVGGETITPPGGGGGDGIGGITTAGGISSLAMTGAGIATLIAIILALLAAGAYLVRENYRKTHATPIA